MNAPVIDVLMTAFNAERTIVASAESILGQSFTRLRLIVVDDGSTDDTLALLHQLAAQDARIVVIHQANTGIVNAARAGLAQCTAEFVARQDADDLSFPQRLGRQVAYLRANPDCVAVSGAAYHIDDLGQRTGFLVALDPPDKSMATSVPSHEPYIMHPFMLVRREALIAAGGYRDVEFAEDTDLCWRLQELGQLHNMPEVLGEYRVHNQSVSSNSIVSGRISAINSQLTAISAIRRRRGRSDLKFSPADVGAYRAAGTLSAILSVVEGRLDEQERRYLQIAASAKLLELSLYRAYNLDVEDCRYLAQACCNIGKPDTSHLRYLRAEASAKLLIEGRIGEMRLLSKGLPLKSIGLRLAKRLLSSLFAPITRRRDRKLYADLRRDSADRNFLLSVEMRP